MKKILFVLISACLIGNAMGQTKSSKRGVSFEFRNEADLEVLSSSTSWFYNWANTPKNATDIYTKYGYDFCPMAWNDKYNANDIRNYVRTHPECKYILAYNEPNFKKQANMTPQKAAQNWPELKALAKELNLRIISPAVNYSPDAPYQDPWKWLDEFFAQPGVSLDDIHGIACHCYMSWGSATSWYVGEYIKKYNKPVWLTEFCAWDDFYNREGGSASAQRKYMVETIDYLETEPMVERYAWFIPRTDEGIVYPWMQLLTMKPGELTETGLVFTEMSSYDENYYHDIAYRIEAEHYTRMKGVYLEKTTDQDGKINIWDLKKDEMLEYNVEIPESGEYNIFIRTASATSIQVDIEINGISSKLQSIESTEGPSQWNTQKFTLNLEKGKQKIAFKIKEMDNENQDFKFNWWAISKGDTAPGAKPTDIPVVEKQQLFTVYPNPVEAILSFQFMDAYNSDKKIILSDIHGRKIYEGSHITSIDMSAYSSGIYFLSIYDKENGRQTVKIIKK